MAKKVRTSLREYYLEYKPQKWIFEGRYGKRYSTGSIQKFFDKAKQHSGIIRRVTRHSLGHSFALHLVDRGIGIKIVQELLGHASIKTTQIYAHISMKKLENVKSPLEHLDI